MLDSDTKKTAPTLEPSVLDAPAATPTSEEETETLENGMPALVRHSKRTQWGLAILVRRIEDRAMLQFQDGRMRSFKKGFYHLLEAVDRPYDVTMELVDALRSMLPEEDVKPGARRVRPIQLDEQIAYFFEMFDGGFMAETYTETHRSDGRKRPLKRHRDGVVDRAAKELTRKKLSGPVADAMKGMGAVLKLSDLVGAKERKVFLAIAEEDHEVVVQSLRALLYGTSPLVQRLDGFVSTLERTMGQTPSWELATFFAGVAQPDEHIVVKPELFQRQALWMAPGLRCSDRPMGLLYERMRTMALGVRERIEALDLTPRDLLDVRDFMWLTLKPAARTRIAEMRLAKPVAVSSSVAEADVEAA